jgi:hypothetical protein
MDLTDPHKCYTKFSLLTNGGAAGAGGAGGGDYGETQQPWAGRISLMRRKY